MITLSNITKKYGDITALDDCSITLPNVGFVAIVGESGSGKTTLLNILGLLENDYDGQILYRGRAYESDEDKSDFRLKNISYIFQDSLMLPYLSVEDNLVLQAELAGRIISTKEMEQIAGQLNVSELLKRKTNELSAGQKQRLAIMRALITKSKVVLADEPTGNLDGELAEDVFKCLKFASKESLVVVVTHDETMAAKYSERVIRLSKGKIIYDSCKGCSDMISNNDCGETATRNNSNSIHKSFCRIIRGDIKNKPKMVRKMISGIVLSLLAVSLCVTLGISVFQTSRNTELFVMETDLIEVTETLNSNADILRNACSILDSLAYDYSFLEDDSRFEEVTFSYKPLKGIFSNGDINTNLQHVEVIDSNVFYKNKMKALDIWGDFPDNKYEIVLGYDAARELFPGEKPENIVGNKIMYGFSPECTELVIAGINYKADMSGHVNSYFLSDTVRYLDEKRINSIYVFSQHYFDQHPELFNGNGYSISDFGVAVSIADEKLDSHIVCGRNIEKAGEIVFNLNCLQNMTDIFGRVELTNSQNYALLQTLIGTEVAFGVNGGTIVKLTVVGIADDNSQAVNNCYLLQEDINTMKIKSPEKIKIYAKDTNDVTTIISDLEELGFEATAPYYYLKDSIGTEFIAFGVVFVFIGIVVFFSSVKNVSNLIRTNVEHSLNEIGLLRTLGLNSKKTGNVYFLETLAIATRALLISGLLFPILFMMLIGLTKIGLMSFVSIKSDALIIGLVSLLLFTFLESFLATWPVMKQIEKKNIIALVRNIEQ